MTHEQINIAIAESLWWQKCHALYGVGCGVPKGFKVNDDNYRPVPKYTTSLDAVHEAWLSLNPAQRQRFVVELGKVGGSPSSGYWPTSEMIGATARQRAEAFLKTLNKWKD